MAQASIQKQNFHTFVVLSPCQKENICLAVATALKHESEESTTLFSKVDS